MSEQSLPAVPQCDPRAGYLAQRDAIDAAVASVFENGRYILGPEVKAFESEFAAFCTTQHALGVANGTDALELALRALGIRPGDAVATVSNTAVATVVAIRSLGAIPIFVDVGPSDGLMDAERLAATLALAKTGALADCADGIRAIVPVHLYGRCADMTTILALAAEAGVPVVEDCAQAHGAMHAGRLAGTFGVFGSFSFYPTKNLGAFGDGGAVVCSDPAMAERIRLLREYGWRDRYVSAIEGGNSRLDEIQAAILRVKLRQLAEDNARRCALASRYRECITNADVLLPSPDPNGYEVHHQFVVRTERRDNLQNHLRRHGIGSLVHYPVPVHAQPAYASKSYVPMPLPNTEQLAKCVLSLPMYPQLSQESVERVAEAVNRWRPGQRE